MKRISLRTQFKTAKDIRQEFIEDTATEISARTIQRKLKKLGLDAQSPAKKPLLTKTMSQKRLKWANQHSNWTLAD